MKDVLLVFALIALFWGSAYILGSQIRKGLERNGNTYNVQNGVFKMAETQVESIWRKILKEGDGK